MPWHQDFESPLMRRVRCYLSVDICRHMGTSICAWLHLHMDTSSILRMLFNQ
jgi:hypothetical protein